MTDDIVIRLRQGDPICIDGHIYRGWSNEAADEIERLRKLAKDLYEETKRCGSKHDVIATWAWEEYEMDFLDG